MASIATLGVTVTTTGATEATAALDKLEKAGAKAERQVAKVAPSMDRTAMSAKQLAFATRTLPAQFTDIATSLASGQRPLQVLLQQGGQIKDMFGGIGPALRAMGGYVVGLINPLTLGAAAVGGLAYAWKSASDEADTFNRALIVSGNFAQTTAEQLAELARQYDRTLNVTQGKAAEVLAQVAASGQFTAEQLDLVTRAALQMEDATGKAIGDTIKEFVALKGDPVDAILKLNDTQHFLTQSTLDQIQSLKDQGREADAAAAAMRAYADTINDRAPRVVENLGLMETGWRKLKGGAKEAWDEVIDGFRRADVEAKQGIESLGRYWRALKSPGALLPFALQAAGSPAFDASSSGRTAVASGRDIVDNQRRKAQLEFDRLHDRFLTRAEQLEKAKAEAQRIGVAAGKSQLEIDKEKARIEAAFESRERKTRTRRGRALPDFAKGAADELQKMLETEAKARDQFNAMAATLEGPLAEAAYQYAQQRKELNQLAKDGAIDTASLEQAQANLARQYEADTKAIKARLDPGRQLLDDLRFEIELTKMGTAERAAAIQMRGLEADAVRKYGDAIVEANRQIEQSHELIDRMDDFRDIASDFLVDLPTKGKGAWRDFLDDLSTQLRRWAANGVIEQLFGARGTNGQGTTGGGWLSSILGTYFNSGAQTDAGCMFGERRVGGFTAA